MRLLAPRHYMAGPCCAEVFAKIRVSIFSKTQKGALHSSGTSCHPCIVEWALHRHHGKKDSTEVRLLNQIEEAKDAKIKREAIASSSIRRKGSIFRLILNKYLHYVFRLYRIDGAPSNLCPFPREQAATNNSDGCYRSQTLATFSIVLIKRTKLSDDYRYCDIILCVILNSRQFCV